MAVSAMRRLCWLATVASLGSQVSGVAYVLVAGLVDECRQLIDGLPHLAMIRLASVTKPLGRRGWYVTTGKPPCQLVENGINELRATYQNAASKAIERTATGRRGRGSARRGKRWLQRHWAPAPVLRPRLRRAALPNLAVFDQARRAARAAGPASASASGLGRPRPPHAGPAPVRPALDQDVLPTPSHSASRTLYSQAQRGQMSRWMTSRIPSAAAARSLMSSGSWASSSVS